MLSTPHSDAATTSFQCACCSCKRASSHILLVDGRRLCNDCFLDKNEGHSIDINDTIALVSISTSRQVSMRWALLRFLVYSFLISTLPFLSLAGLISTAVGWNDPEVLEIAAAGGYLNLAILVIGTPMVMFMTKRVRNIMPRIVVLASDYLFIGTGHRTASFPLPELRWAIGWAAKDALFLFARPSRSLILVIPLRRIAVGQTRADRIAIAHMPQCAL